MISIPTCDDYNQLYKVISSLEDRIRSLELRPNPLRWLSVSAAAEALGMSETQIRRLVKDNRLTSRKEGRKVLIDMESVVERAKVGKNKHWKSSESDKLKESKLRLKASLAKSEMLKAQAKAKVKQTVKK